MTTTTHDDYGIEQSDALRALLEDMAANYVDPADVDLPASMDEEDFMDSFEVKFTDELPGGDTPRASDSLTDPWVAVSTDTAAYRVNGAQALRCVVDTLSHECEHIRKSELSGKRDFMEEYDDGYAKLAGMVVNVLEDQYIDRTRTLRFRGLKKTHAWKIERMMEDDDRRPPMGDLDPAEQPMEGFIQLAHAGTVKGFSDAEPEVQQALTELRPLVYRVRFTDDQAGRLDIARDVMDILVDVVPKRPDMPDWMEELIRELLEDLETHMDESEVPDDESFDPDGAEVDEDGDPIDGDEAEGDGEESDEDADEDADGDGSGEGEADEDGEDGDGGGDGDTADEDGDGAGERDTSPRRLTELTGGRDDASHIRIE